MSLIWATRGRSWGFRFLLDGGHRDPLPHYESAFAGTQQDRHAFRRVGTITAARFPDPLGRLDQAGRPIPHQLVLEGSLATKVGSAADVERLVWPLLEPHYARVWDVPAPPNLADGLIDLGARWDEGADD